MSKFRHVIQWVALACPMWPGRLRPCKEEEGEDLKQTACAQGTLSVEPDPLTCAWKKTLDLTFLAKKVLNKREGCRGQPFKEWQSPRHNISWLEPNGSKMAMSQLPCNPEPQHLLIVALQLSDTSTGAMTVPGRPEMSKLGDSPILEIPTTFPK